MPSACSPGFCKQERRCDEEAALEGADLEEVAGDVERALAGDQMAANRGRKARRHPADAQVAVSQERIEPSIAAGNIDHCLQVRLSKAM